MQTSIEIHIISILSATSVYTLLTETFFPCTKTFCLVSILLIDRRS